MYRNYTFTVQTFMILCFAGMISGTTMASENCPIQIVKDVEREFKKRINETFIDIVPSKNQKYQEVSYEFIEDVVTLTGALESAQNSAWEEIQSEMAWSISCHSRHGRFGNRWHVEISSNTEVPFEAVSGSIEDTLREALEGKRMEYILGKGKSAGIDANYTWIAESRSFYNEQLGINSRGYYNNPEIEVDQFFLDLPNDGSEDSTTTYSASYLITDAKKASSIEIVEVSSTIPSYTVELGYSWN